MLAQFADEREETFPTSNLHGKTKIKHVLRLRGNYKQMKVWTETNLSGFSPFLPNLCLMGLLNWLLPSQFNSMTSIFEQLIYTERGAKLVTPKFHNHYIHIIGIGLDKIFIKRVMHLRGKDAAFSCVGF